MYGGEWCFDQKESDFYEKRPFSSKIDKKRNSEEGVDHIR